MQYLFPIRRNDIEFSFQIGRLNILGRKFDEIFHSGQEQKDSERTKEINKEITNFCTS